MLDCQVTMECPSSHSKDKVCTVITSASHVNPVHGDVSVIPVFPLTNIAEKGKNPGHPSTALTWVEQLSVAVRVVGLAILAD